MMPHKCASCGQEFADTRVLMEGCPECGGRKFIFSASEGEKRRISGDIGNSPSKSAPSDQNIDRNKAPSTEKTGNMNQKTIESISILEPGRYDLNLIKLAASDDLVVRVGENDTYRLDLHSMVRQKKKK